MRQKVLYTVFIVVIGLSIIGFIGNLIINPKQLFTSFFTMLGIAFLIVIGAYLFLTKFKGNSTKDARKYRAAVKQSKRKYNAQQQTKTIKTTKRKQKKRRSHLTVIEGKKSDQK